MIFYDIETSGLSKPFDQILQFAAIRTNDDLEELDRFEIRSRLQPHIVPSPGALNATRMTINEVLDPSRPSHYEMVCRIREALVGWCPATFIGYNSLRFDEEFLRQAFYQCLHPPYLTNTGGSGRADALHIIRAAVAIDPAVLALPLNDKGKPVFKLDRLAPANGLAHLNAHDALADVEATIHLCRLVKERSPIIWRHALAAARKASVQQFIQRDEPFLLVEPFGAGARTVTTLGPSAVQPNAVYCFDLMSDPQELTGLSDLDLAKRLRGASRPVRRIKTNSAPILVPLEDGRPWLQEGGEGDAFARALTLRADVELSRRLIALSEPEAVESDPSPHVEQQIYEGFWSDADRRLTEDFHRSDWEDRVVIAGQFADLRLRRLARRIMFFERPDLMSDEARTAMDEEVRRRRLGEADVDFPWLTALTAQQDLDGLLAKLPPERHVEFESYRAFLAACSS